MDLTDEQWAIITPLLKETRNGLYSRRELVNAVLYLVKMAANGVIYLTIFRLIQRFTFFIVEQESAVCGINFTTFSRGDKKERG